VCAYERAEVVGHLSDDRHESVGEPGVRERLPAYDLFALDVADPPFSRPRRRRRSYPSIATRQAQRVKPVPRDEAGSTKLWAAARGMKCEARHCSFARNPWATLGTPERLSAVDFAAYHPSTRVGIASCAAARVNVRG